MEFTFEVILLWIALLINIFVSIFNIKYFEKKAERIEEAEKRISELYFKVND